MENVCDKKKTPKACVFFIIVFSSLSFLDITLIDPFIFLPLILLFIFLKVQPEMRVLTH